MLTGDIEQGKENNYRELILLATGHLVADINNSALPAMLPFIKEAMGLSYAMSGTVILVYNIASSVIQPAFGYLTDRKSLLWFLPLGCMVAAWGMGLASGLILGLSFGMGGLGAAILGVFADLWGIPTTLWIIAFLPCGAFLMAVLIPYLPNARTSITPFEM